MINILTGICTILIYILAGTSLSFGQDISPKTVRDFFHLIPTEYFGVACCDGNRDEFIRKYVTVTDTANGYMEGSDTKEDPKYQGFKLKVFFSKNTTIAGLYSHGIGREDYYFLEYKNGKLLNISKSIPNYSRDNIYELPRKASTIKVYKKNYSSLKKEISVDETVTRGNYIYSLIWQNGKFTVKK